MPELPEVETMRRGLLPIVGSRIVAAEKVPCRRKPIAITPGMAAFRKRVVGRIVSSIERAGKRVVIRLDSADAIVMEPRMSGLVLMANAPTQEHLRFRLRLSDDARREVLYWDRRGLGSVRLFSDAQFQIAFGRAKLGPDAMEVNDAELCDQFARSSRAIKVALLDQHALAGIGNIYASEILHLAGIHPATRCNKIKKRDWPKLHRAMRDVLELAIRHEGSTLRDGTYRNALNQEASYQNHHRVYGREGDKCPTCHRGTIQRTVQAHRATFFCPECQRK